MHIYRDRGVERGQKVREKGTESSSNHWFTQPRSEPDQNQKLRASFGSPTLVAGVQGYFLGQIKLKVKIANRIILGTISQL